MSERREHLDALRSRPIGELIDAYAQLDALENAIRAERRVCAPVTITSSTKVAGTSPATRPATTGLTFRRPDGRTLRTTGPPLDPDTRRRIIPVTARSCVGARPVA